MVLVLDNVLPNFDEYINKVKTSNFQDILSQNIVYSDLSQELTAKDIYNEIEKRTDLQPKEKLSFLRAYKDNPDYRHPMWIHTDVLFADYIGIFFIQPSEFPQDDGVALWKNKEIDDIQLYTKDHNGEKNKIIDRQSLDPDKWEMWKRVEFKQNRLFICPAAYFHSKASYKNSGKTLDDCRIVHVLFFDKRSA